MSFCCWLILVHIIYVGIKNVKPQFILLVHKLKMQYGDLTPELSIVTL